MSDYLYQIIGWLTNTELENMWKEEGLGTIQAFSQSVWGNPRETSVKIASLLA
jgi:hypothetical protein